MTTPDPRTRAQLEVSSRSMPPIEESNLASVPAPSCRAQRSGKLWDQWGREGPRAQAFLHLPHSGLQPLYGLVYEPGWGSPFMPTCPIPGLSCREPPPHTHTWPLTVSPIQSNFVLLCLLLLCCLLTNGLTLQPRLVRNRCI